MSPAIAIVSTRGNSKGGCMPELPSEDLPQKARLLCDLASLGLRIPETVCIRVPFPDGGRWATAETLQGQLDRIVDEGVMLLETVLTVGEGGASRRDVAIAIRSAIPASPTRPRSLLGVQLISEDGATQRSQACAAIEQWAIESMKVLSLQEVCGEEFSFLVQRWVAPGNEIGHAFGYLWTMHPLSGLEGPFGFFFEGAGKKHPQVLSFEEWASLLPEYAAEVSCWVQKLNVAIGFPCRLRLVVGNDGLHVVSAQRGVIKGKASEAFLRKALDSDIKQPRRAVLSVPPDFLSGRGPLSVQQRDMLEPVAFGLSIGQGVACGRLATSEESVRQLASEGYPVIWVQEEFEPKHVPEFVHVAGLVVDRAGPASHVVVLARGLGIAVVPGVRGLQVPRDEARMLWNASEVLDREWLTIDEASGSVRRGRVESFDIGSVESELLRRIADQCDTAVLVNADSSRAAEAGMRAGAQGVGLCRSESHLYEDQAARAVAEYLRETASLQRPDVPEVVLATLRRRLEEVLWTAGGSWVHYRLLDPDPGDFLCKPDPAAATRPIAGALGDRGCRWGLRTGFYLAQVEVVRRAIESTRTAGVHARLAVIVPLIISLGEVAECRLLFQRLVSLFEGDEGVSLRFGCMIETPRAALLASRIATLADVLCFGTNDLTQTVWAWSRDGCQDALHHYLATTIVREDPFVRLDVPGVGQLVAAAIKGTKSASPNTDVVVCGEQAGDPASIAILHEIGADTVSCSPSRVPTAILASWQAQIRREVDTEIGAHQSISEIGAAEWSTRLYLSRVRSARAAQDILLGRKLANEWAQLVCAELGLKDMSNWKFFKRDLVAHFFGEREHRRFMQGWCTADMLSYALWLKRAGHTVRYSVFPADIACHAVSRILDAEEPDEQWHREIELLDHSTPVEVFPQQPEDQMCLRAIFSEGKMDIEMGQGQAMYVFEQERGMHPVVRGVVDSIGRCELLKESAPITGNEALISLSSQFIFERGFWLFRRLGVISESLGLPWVGVEGYWCAVKRETPFICDIDLPLDLAFHG